MYIYFARSIRGDRTEMDEVINKMVVATIRGCGHRPQFDLPINILRVGLTQDEYIYQRDLYWLDKCDAVIAEVSNASTGVGYEIGYAKYERHIPIQFVARADAHVSAMINGGFEIARYDSIDALYGPLKAFMEKVTA